MFGNHIIANELARFFAQADHECRLELIDGIIVGERDYVSTLATRIRSSLQGRYNNIQCHSQTLDTRTERRIGADGIIIFRTGSNIKVGVFEAKRPQLTQSNYRWDELSDRGISHFSEQILKQRCWSGRIAVWEMIFNDVRIGNESPPLEYFGSSCVWHDTAYHYMHNQRLLLRPWNTTELKRLLSFGGVNFFTVIHDLVSCKSGEIHHLDVEHDRCIIHDLDNQTKLVVPVPGQDSSKEFDESVEEFMYLHGFDHYLGIDFSGMSF